MATVFNEPLDPTVYPSDLALYCYVYLNFFSELNQLLLGKGVLNHLEIVYTVNTAPQRHKLTSTRITEEGIMCTYNHVKSKLYLNFDH